MKIILNYLVIAACYHLSYSLLRRTRKTVPSIERYNFFDSELLKVIGSEKSGNLVISPVGVKIILGMLLEGAYGETARELRNILRLPHDSIHARKEYDTWLSVIESANAHNVLKISNMMFVSKKFPVRHAYLKILKRHYGAGVTPVKFHNRKETSRTINNWVVNKTDNLITKLIEENQINSDAQMIMLSALYFKGFWMKPFEKEKEAQKCFHTLDSGCVKTNMLSVTGYYKYGYVDKLDSHAIQIPYAGGKYFMLILLPNSKENIFQMTRDLVHINLKYLLQGLHVEEVFIRLPQFDISYSEDISDYLMQLRVSEIFHQDADFSKIFESESDKPFLDHIFHSAKISVNEDGTEASAVTGASFVPLMGGATSSFNAHHPFLFFIMDSAINSVIFAGRFMKPDVSDPTLCSISTGKHPFSSMETTPEEQTTDSFITQRIISTKSNLETTSATLKDLPKMKTISKIHKPLLLPLRETSTERVATSNTWPSTRIKQGYKSQVFSATPQVPTTSTLKIHSTRPQKSLPSSLTPSKKGIKISEVQIPSFISSYFTISSTPEFTAPKIIGSSELFSKFDSLISEIEHSTTPISTAPTNSKQPSHSFEILFSPKHAPTILTPAVSDDSKQASLISQNSSASPSSTTFLKMNAASNIRPASEVSQTSTAASVINFPTEKPTTLKLPSLFQELLSQNENHSGKSIKPVLIEGETPFMFYPFSDKLKEVYAGIRASTAKSTLNPDRIPIKHITAVQGDEKRQDRWKRLESHFSNPDSWLHRVLYFA